MRCRVAFRFVAILLYRLAFLAPNLLARIAHAFSLVRLWRIISANISGYLTNKLLFDPTKRKLGILVHSVLNVFWYLNQNWLLNSKRVIQHLTLLRSFE